VLLARIVRFFTRFRRLQPLVGRVHACLLRHSAGRLHRSLLLAGGQPVLALTTTGRRSGVRRTTVVAYLRDGDRYAIGAVNLGSDRTPAWCLNLLADPDAEIEVSGTRMCVRARRADAAEAQRLWEGFFEQLPAIRNSLALAKRDVPLMVLEPVDATPGPSRAA
jgi:deazaflavin-dependent oxidoreductase (nitroreductase family)